MHGIILCHSLRMIFNFGEFIERIDNLNITACVAGDLQTRNLAIATKSCSAPCLFFFMLLHGE